MIESFFWRKFLVRSGLAKLLPSVRRELSGGEAYLQYYSDRTLSVPLTQLADNALLPNVRTPDSIDFACGVPRCELNLDLRRAMHENRPTIAWGDRELRSELAARFQLDHGVEHEAADEVLVTHGAAGAFAAAIDAFVNPGDAAVAFDPMSPVFSIGLKHRRARIRNVPAWSEDGRLRFAMDRFTKAMRGASS